MSKLKKIFAFTVASTLGFTACGKAPLGSAAHTDATESDGYGWYHVSLLATDGTSIKLDYQVQSYGRDSFVARPLWVNVERSGLSSSSQARIVIISASDPQASLVTQDLTRSDDKFTAAVNSDLFVGYPGDSGVSYQIAVVIDGQWLKDPVSGSSNFSFELAQ